MVKKIFPIMGIALLVGALVSSCFRIFTERTVIDYFIRNSSSFEIVVKYATIESVEDADSTMLLAHSNKSSIFRYSIEGLHDKPNSDIFSNYLHYFDVFVDDTLVYSQNPTEKQQWSLEHDTFDDEMNIYWYVFTITDSLLLKDESP